MQKTKIYIMSNLFSIGVFFLFLQAKSLSLIIAGLGIRNYSLMKFLTRIFYYHMYVIMSTNSYILALDLAPIHSPVLSQ